MKLYDRQFSPDLDLPAVPVTTTVLIASTPRCGSHMLGHAMAATGRLGVPYEYANPANLAEWTRRLDTTAGQETLAALTARRTTPNGVFAIKAHYSHVDGFGGPAAFFDLWPDLRVVHLVRADVLRQAISYAIAKQTGVWIAGQEPEGDLIRFDPDLIAACLDDIAVQNARWTAAFALAGIVPLALRYREVAHDTAATVSRVARHAGVLGPDETLAVAATTQRQSRADRTEDWVARYAAARRTPPARRPLLSRLRRLVAR